MLMETPKKKSELAKEILKDNPLRDQAHEVHSDVLGSYTGTPYEIGDVPVQDVDDL